LHCPDLRRPEERAGAGCNKGEQGHFAFLPHLIRAAAWLSSLDLPVRLIAFPEGALQAFPLAQGT
jgi:hypothetical protein